LRFFRKEFVTGFRLLENSIRSIKVISSLCAVLSNLILKNISEKTMKTHNKTKLVGVFARSACSVLVASTLLGQAAMAEIKPVNDIRVNQHGYLPSQPKVAVYNGPANANWELRKANGDVVASGITTAYGYDKASGDSVSHIDFSSYTGTAKNLTLHIGSSESYAFDISAFTYSAMKEDAMTYFYHQRFGMPVLADLVGEEFAREAGHLMDSNLECDDNLPSDWDSSSECNYSLDVRGGHQDAGDYGGYVTNGGYYTWLLNYVYESMPASFGDGSLRIPENNNGIPDILDEARYELDFIMRMQVPQDKSPYPGMIHHKKSWQDWAPFPLVPADDNGVYWGNPASKRTIKPVSTSATLNGAAVMAQGARIWKQFPSAQGFDGASEKYHETLLRNAEIAWDAAVANPELYASSDASMGSGPYNDSDVSDEFYWAAAELYLTTKKSKYKTYLLNSPHFAKYNAFDWQLINVGGNLSLVLHDADSGLTSAQKTQLKNGLKNYADATLATIDSEGYLAPLAPKAGSPSGGVCSGTYTYPWGAVGSFMLSNGVQMAAAHQLTNDQKYLDGVTQTMDHVLGTNALDRSYLTGYGENPTTEPHHRFWLKSKGNPVTAVAEAVSIPYPAAVAGGPQNDLVEDGTSGPETDGTPCAAPAKSYADHWNNYSSNEITVNWNANLTAVLAFIDNALPAPNDNSAPNAPSDLNPQATSGSSINVSWNVASDNSRIRHYNVFMKPAGGSYALRGTTKSLAYSVVPLQPNTQYCFKVSAEDYAGLVSVKSAEKCVKTDLPSKFEIYYQPDNSAMSDYVGTGAISAPEAPAAVLGNGWYQYKFHENGPRFDFHFSMPNWGSPQRFSPDGSGTNWKVYDTDFSVDGVIWLTADKVFHKTPPNVDIVDPGCEPNCEVPNVAPTANNQSVNGDEDETLTITLSGSDSDGTVVSYQIDQNPAHGNVSLSSSTATYTPDSGFFGSDNFKFSVIDDDGAVSNSATVSITLAEDDVVVEPTSDLVCSVADTTWSNAQSKFSSVCSDFTRDSCQSVNVSGKSWVMCSSKPTASNYLAVISGNSSRVEAEDYARALDTSAGNTGGAYRTGDVDISTTSDSGGGHNVGWIRAGEQLTYDVLVTKTGIYKLKARVTSPNSTGKFSIVIDGQTLVNTKSVPNTGSWGAYQTIEMDLGELSEGSHVVDVDINSHSFNLNWVSFEFVEDDDTTGPTDPAACTSTINIPWNTRTEVTLTAGACVKFDRDLSGETVQFWDSDTNSSCDFRGAFESVDGTGSFAINGNYKSTNVFSGTILKPTAGFSCDFVKIRAY
jgi:endoglucanase